MKPSRFDIAFAVGGFVAFVFIMIATGYLIAHPPRPAQSPAVVIFPS